MKPILQAAIAAALATGGLIADEPKPGAPLPTPAPPVKSVPADQTPPEGNPPKPAVPNPLVPPPKAVVPKAKTTPSPAPPVKSVPAVKAPPEGNPPKPVVPNPLVPPPKAVEPPAITKPAKPAPSDTVGVDEIKKKGPLHFAAGNDLPLSGKVVIFGDDGAKQREVVYKDGKIRSWTEWHTNNVRIERTYAGGHEVKRTGWQGERKWFEITFGAVSEEKHNGGTHVDPPKETPPEKKGEEPKEPTDPIEPEKKDENPSVIPDPTKNGETVPKGGDPTPKKTEPVIPPEKPNDQSETTPPPSPVLTKVTDHKWPAFVPGNPVFPEEKPPLPKPQEDKGTPHEKPGANSNLNKLQNALGVEPKGEPRPKDHAAKPIDGSTLLAGAPDFLETRSNHLIYSKNANEPFSGKSVLFEIIKEATGEFIDGQPVTKETPYKRFEGEIALGRREGLGVEFYPDGSRKYVGVFKGGVLHDGWVYWYYPGTAQKKMETNYKNGQIIDSRIWNRDGTARW